MTTPQAIDQMTTTETEYRAKSSPGQNDLLEAYFRAHPNVWIAMPVLVEVTGSYVVHSRVADCRNLRGMHIEHRNKWQVNGRRVCCSQYRFVPSESQPILL